jgi:hypothetical protein
MAAISWASGQSGDWTTAADWTGGVVPGAGDDVTIAAAGTYTVTISTADEAHSLTLDDAKATVSDTGTLTLGTKLTLTAGTFALDSAGMIVGGTLSATGGVFAWDGGALAGVTYDGTLNLSVANASLIVTGGFTATGAGGVGAGTINVTGNAATLRVAGGETLDNATLNIGATPVFGNQLGGVFELYDPNDTGSVLTLGKNFNVVHTVGAALIEYNWNDDSIINNGTVTAGASGGVFTINSGNFTNNGSIIVSNGDDLEIESVNFTNAAAGAISITGAGTTAEMGVNTNWSNAGKITVGSGATLTLSGIFTTAALTNITDSGGTIGIAGALTNTGAVLTVGPGTALPHLELESGFDNGGRIVGGTIVDKGSGIQFDGGGLVGVTYDGTLDLSASGASLSISGGFKATGVDGAGPGTIDLTGDGSTLNVAGGETLHGATLNIGSAGDSTLIVSNALLRLGKHFNIDVSTGVAVVKAYGAGLVDNGAITVDAPHGELAILGGTFDERGSLSVSAGAIVYLEPDSFTNLSGATLRGGRYEVDAGSTLELNQGAQVVTDAATIVLSGAGSTIQSLNSQSAEVAIDSTLTTIGATGTLELLAGRNWSSALAMSNSGTLDLGGGTFAAASLINRGTVRGAGVIAVAVADNGSMAAVGGALDFTEALSGTGSMSADSGATLEVDSTAAATLSMSFRGASAILALKDPEAFAATIKGFAPTDAIDLLDIKATSATLGAGDTLVITDGSTAVATLQLAGTYTGDTFNTASDGKGGTNITVTTPGGAFAPPTSHQFIEAMASLGSTAGGAIRTGDAWAVHEPVLVRPRAMIA